MYFVKHTTFLVSFLFVVSTLSFVEFYPYERLNRKSLDQYLQRRLDITNRLDILEARTNELDSLRLENLQRREALPLPNPQLGLSFLKSLGRGAGKKAGNKAGKQVGKGEADEPSPKLVDDALTRLPKGVTRECVIGVIKTFSQAGGFNAVFPCLNGPDKQIKGDGMGSRWPKDKDGKPIRNRYPLI